MRGLNSPTTEKWAAPLWTRKRMLMLAGGFTATILLLLHIATITYEYEIPHTPFTASTSEPSRMVFQRLLEPSHTILRTFDEKTFNFDDRYRFVKNLANGYEGAARVYKDTHTNQDIIIKSWFKTTRQEPVPASVAAVLLEKHNVTVKDWPAEIVATLRDYQSPYYSPSDHSISYAIDAFYTDVPADAGEFGWRIVMPLYSYGTLEHSINAAAFLNLTIEEIDWLYRPRFRRIWQMAAKLNTAVEPNSTEVGYCHDDVKMDNIFHTDEMGNELLGDMGQVRPLNDPFHFDWKDCRLVDSQRAWRTYISLLRWAQDRYTPAEQRFEPRLWEKKEEWTKAYFKWYDTLYTPFQTLESDPFWKNMQTIWKRSSITMPAWRDGKKVRMALSRDQAFVEIDNIRKELAQLNKELDDRRAAEEKMKQEEEERKTKGLPEPVEPKPELKEIVFPWWWSDLPPVPGDGDVNKELAVYWASSELVGAGRSWIYGKSKEELEQMDAEKAKKKLEEEEKKKLEEATAEAEKAKLALTEALKKAEEKPASPAPAVVPEIPAPPTQLIRDGQIFTP